MAKGCRKALCALLQRRNLPAAYKHIKQYGEARTEGTGISRDKKAGQLS